MNTTNFSYGMKSLLTVYGAYCLSTDPKDWALAEAVSMLASGIFGLIAIAYKNAEITKTSSVLFLGSCVFGLIQSYEDYQKGDNKARWKMVSNSFFIICTSVSLAGGPTSLVITTYGLGLVVLIPSYIPKVKGFFYGN